MAVAGNEDDDRLRAAAGADSDEWGPGGAVPGTGRTGADPPRPGPSLLESDTWGEPPAVTTARTYAGRHHINVPPPRVRLAIGAGLAGLVAVVAMALVLSGSPSPAPSAVSSDSAAPDLGDGRSPSSAYEGSSSTGAPAAPTTQPAVATGKPTPKPAPPPFATLTFEAEAGSPTVTLGGSAWIASYDGASNGKIARNLGDWDMRGGPGSLRLNGVKFPTAGTYVLTIYFVHPDNEETRTAQVTVSGLDPVTVTFNGSSRCCGTKKVRLAIPAGTRTITISNPTGRAPSIDKVVISRG